MPSFYNHLRHEFASLSSTRRSRLYTQQHGPPPPVPQQESSDASLLSAAPVPVPVPVPVSNDGNSIGNSNGHELSTCVVEVVSFQTELYPVVYPVLLEKLLDDNAGGGKGYGDGKCSGQQAGLTDVKYKSRLNGSESCIERLPIQLRHVNANIVNSKVDQALNQVLDPYCKIYIVAIEDIDEYRGIVRPLLKKWVSEREKLKEQYILLYVNYMVPAPTQTQTSEERIVSDDSATEDATSSATSTTTSISSINGVRNNLQSRVPTSAMGLTAAFRARMAGVGDGSNGNGHFSHGQFVKEMFRKMSYDFGSNRTALLSIPDKNSVLTTKFLTQLGQTIVASLETKTQLLDEELRSMLDQRVKSKGEEWNFAKFFLAKERLAYTFEHMQLENEALLQYEELGAFVFTESKLPTTISSVSCFLGDEYKRSMGLFLTRLDANEVTDQELYERLFQRESHFHFLLSHPIQALLLARRFIVSSYKRFLDNEKISRIDAEIFGFQACWELYDASKDFFSLYNTGNESSVEGILYSDTEQTQASMFMSSILEFGRRRLFKCADEMGVLSSTVLRTMGKLSHKTLGNWETWAKICKSEGKNEESASQITVSQYLVVHDDPSWIRKSFTSTSTFEAAYLEISRHMILLSERNNFLRSTMRLQHELAEFHILKEEYYEAAQLFQSMIQNKVLDTSWDRVYSWLLFRFACCQRHLKSPKEYLPTLIHSFNPRLASVAPTVALNHLLSDLEAIVMDEEVVCHETFKLFPFLETEVSVSPTSEGRITIMPEQMRKRLTLHRAEVGETIEISCKFLSYFPREIQVNDLQLTIIHRQDFESTTEVQTCYRTLSAGDSIVIKPGKNELTFRWIPMNTGSFIISSLSLLWGKATFIIGQELFSRKPSQGFNITQSTPTQKIELGQLPFLLPEEKQEISSVYRSGMDHVEGGMIDFTSSDGLEIMSPLHASEQWCKHVSLPIEACTPGTVLSHCIPVRALSNVSAMDEVKVTITSNFRHSCYCEEHSKNEPPSNAMECHLEGFLTIQTCMAMEILSAKSYLCGDISMLRISLLNGAPVSLTIKNWQLDLKPPYRLENDEDSNDDLFQRKIAPLEEVYLVFRCLRLEDVATDTGECRADLTIDLVDEFGQTHSQTTPVDFGTKVEQDSDESRDVLSPETEVVLECEYPTANIGTPVSFTYRVDTTKVKEPDKLQYGYSIISNDHGWVLSGKTSGLCKAGDIVDLPFVAIPTRSGSLRSFPVLKLNNIKIPAITHKVPETFLSTPHNKNIALAFALEDIYSC